MNIHYKVYLYMKWIVEFDDKFEQEFWKFSSNVQVEIASKAKLLEDFGHGLGRPNADTLEGSKHSNMKELRLKADNGVWRVAYAFDPERKAILLVAGDKAGISQKRFYKKLISKADERFSAHLSRLGGK